MLVDGRNIYWSQNESLWIEKDIDNLNSNTAPTLMIVNGTKDVYIPYIKSY